MSGDILRVQVIWNNRTPATPFLGFRDLHVNPEPDFPFGRKGLVFASAWDQLGLPGEAIGMLILDGDVAIDPHDNRMMHECIYLEPECVWVAPCKLWPVSHLGPNWVWGHGKERFTQEDVDDPDMFSFSFTYLPAALMNGMMENDLVDLCYPVVDMSTWELARKMGLTVKVARECAPKHLHW
jgi:hypothetical protein